MEAESKRATQKEQRARPVNGPPWSRASPIAPVTRTLSCESTEPPWSQPLIAPEHYKTITTHQARAPAPQSEETAEGRMRMSLASLDQRLHGLHGALESLWAVDAPLASNIYPRNNGNLEIRSAHMEHDRVTVIVLCCMLQIDAVFRC